MKMLTQTIEEKDEEKLSGDEQEKNVDEQKQKLPLHRKILKQWQIGLKLIELLLCILSISLIIDPARKTALGVDYIHHFTLICTSFIGSIVIIVVQLIGRMLGDRVPYKTSVLFSLVGAALSLAAGVLVLADYQHYTKSRIFHPNRWYTDMMCTSGIFAIINSFIYVIDGILTYKYQNNL